MDGNTTTCHYYLQSAGNGKCYADTDWLLNPDNEDPPSLLRSVFRDQQLIIQEQESGLFRYANWLPIHRNLTGAGETVTYQSTYLADYLGLENLYIAFNGYWPEKQACMRTCTFKETEAYVVCGRYYSQKDKTLVVASAGNTARAFARVCSDNGIPLIVFVPERNFSSLWFDKPLDDCVTLVSVSGADYLDAIKLSEQICDGKKFIPEGGVKNVARRDGMGTVVLSAATTIGHIPEYYFQAIGSGSGAIAAWEANQRLLIDGGFGSNKMKLILSQNKPFTPVCHAWNARRRELDYNKIQKEQQFIPELYSVVLSNRLPAYSMNGGLFDALTDTGGEVLAISNEEAREASRIFTEAEGIDIHPAAAVATASLFRKVITGDIEPDAFILLNITGGGEQRFRQEHAIINAEPHLTLHKDVSKEELTEAIMARPLA